MPVLFTYYIMHALNFCIYVFMGGIDLFFRATTHDVTARNRANSKHNSHNDENHVRNWHPFLLHYRVFIFRKMGFTCVCAL